MDGIQKIPYFGPTLAPVNGTPLPDEVRASWAAARSAAADGDDDAELAAYQRAVAVVDELTARPELVGVCREAAWVAFRENRYDEAIAALKLALRVSPRSEPAVRALIYGDKMRMRYRTGQVQLAKEALASARLLVTEGDVLTEAVVRLSEAWLLVQMDEDEVGADLAALALPVLRGREGCEPELADALIILAVGAVMVGDDAEQGVAYAREAVELAAAIGDDDRLADAYNDVAYALGDAGLEDESFAWLEEGVARLKGSRRFVPTFLRLSYARQLTHRGDFREAADVLASTDPVLGPDGPGLPLSGTTISHVFRRLINVELALAERRIDDAQQLIDGVDAGQLAADDQWLPFMERLRKRIEAERTSEWSRLLTRREKEVLEVMADGATNKQVAERLFISVKTVSIHVSHVFDKLGVSNRTEAVAVARRLGLI